MGVDWASDMFFLSRVTIRTVSFLACLNFVHLLMFGQHQSVVPLIFFSKFASVFVDHIRTVQKCQFVNILPCVTYENQFYVPLVPR